MKIINPDTKELIKERNELLQQTMRPEPLPFAVNEEYPIVLDPNMAQFSYCALSDDQVVAHANLWPRIFTSGTQKIRVGLVGNVATREDWRGKGVMATLFEHLTEQAKLQKVDALILWSDLQQFYQKLGFASLGEELRYYFKTTTLCKKLNDSPTNFLPMSPAKIDDKLLAQIEKLRYQTTATLERSTKEFRRLLDIPATNLFCKMTGSTIEAFAIVGKGYDMGGVVHEWGAPSAHDILVALRDISKALEIPEIILLAPASLSEKWQKDLQVATQKAESHPMALILDLTPDKGIKKSLASGFVWGLDSI